MSTYKLLSVKLFSKDERDALLPIPSLAEISGAFISTNLIV